MNIQNPVRRFGRAGLVSLFLALSVLLVSSSALAQGTASSALSGTVVDKNGAVIKGATVTATNKATGQERTATTNDSGEYKIDFLPAGTYDIKISATGFGDVKSEKAELLVGRTNTLDVTMNPGVQTANVTVTAGFIVTSRVLVLPT